MEALPACPSCEASGDNAKELNSVSLIDEFGKMAERSNTEIVYISIDTEEGSQLLHGFGGLAALCRYPMM
jgi:peptide subunit release factor 1 (eRF1)